MSRSRRPIATDNAAPHAPIPSQGLPRASPAQTKPSSVSPSQSSSSRCKLRRRLGLWTAWARRAEHLSGVEQATVPGPQAPTETHGPPMGTPAADGLVGLTVTVIVETVADSGFASLAGPVTSVEQTGSPEDEHTTKPTPHSPRPTQGTPTGTPSLAKVSSVSPSQSLSSPSQGSSVAREEAPPGLMSSALAPQRRAPLDRRHLDLRSPAPQGPLDNCGSSVARRSRCRGRHARPPTSRRPRCSRGSTCRRRPGRRR